MAVQRDKVIGNAEKLVAKGKIEPAIKEYERLLDDNPNDVNTLNRIGDLWVRINRNDEAVKVFARIADHYSKDGFFLKAIAIYKKINKLDPSKLEIYAKLADLYAKQGLAMEAKSQYQVLADYYLKHGDPGNALAIYRKISELDPQSINVHVKLADLYSQNNQTGEALKEYDRVGRMLLKRGMLDEAVQVFKKALKIDSRNVELVESLVTALLEAKDYNNAQTIVETALDHNRENPRLLAAWARILIGKGDVTSARSALERGLAADANDPAIRETLSDLYLRQGNADKALEMIFPLVERALAKGERGLAVEGMNRILRVDSGHAPTLERLVAVYMRLNEETNILAAMNSLAEAHIARGRYGEASKVLERLIQREPQNAQHRNKLAFVKSQGGTDTMPRARTAHDTPTPTPQPAMKVPEPALESFDESPEISLDLDASPPIELDLGGGFEPAAGPPPPRIEREMEVPFLEAEEAGEDLDFITEHLTEAEVFAKYGLGEKATEHLRAVVERAPKHLAAHDKLFRVLLDEGEVEAARAAASQYLAVLQEKGDSETADTVRSEFLARGLSLAPAAAAKPPAPPQRPRTVERPRPAPAPPPPPPASKPDLTQVAHEDEISFDLDSGAELELDTSVPEEVVEPAIEEAPIEIEVAEEPAIAFEEEEAALTLEPELEEPIAFEPAEEPVAPAVEPEPFFGVEAEQITAAPEVLSAEEISEIDFYIEQELFDEARAKLDALSARFPGKSEIDKRRKRLHAAIAAASAIASAAAAPQASPKPAPKPAPQAAPNPPPKPQPPPPPKAAPKPAAKQPPAPAPPVLSRDEIESELLSALPEDDELIPAPPPPAAAAPPPPPLEQVVEENLFADEDDFFDLAAELESELEEDTEQISLSEEEQSLEEIFKEFKKGVEQQLDSEDYDTHYNLGIAYKEMGLIDEAIGEFQLASKDPKRAVECASMLGLCFLEKGMPQLAIKWYRKGLEMPEISEEEHIGLLYDLGSAYMEVGDTDNAQKAFMEVYGMNSNYRDIVSRIKQLEDARK